MAKQKGKPERKLHKWKYSSGFRWGRTCVICGARQRIRDRPRKTGPSHVYGSTVPEFVTKFPDGTESAGGKIPQCPGGRQ